MLVACDAAVSFGSEKDPAWQPRQTSWTRDEGLRHEGSDGSNANTVWATDFQSEQDTTHTATSERYAAVGLRCRDILIVFPPDEALLGLCAEALLEELVGHPGTERIIARREDQVQLAAGRLPDITFRLSDGGGLAMVRTGDQVQLKAKVRLEGQHGNAGAERHFRSPRTRARMTAETTHQSRTTLKEAQGISAPEYREASRAIGKELALRVRDWIKGINDEHGRAPNPPAELVKEGSPAPVIAWPEGLAPRLLQSGHDGFFSNLTTWELDPSATQKDDLALLQSALEDRDWKARNRSDELLSLTRGEHEVISVRPFSGLWASVGTAREASEREVPTTIRITYGRARGAAIDALLNSRPVAEVGPEFLAMHAKRMSAATFDRFMSGLIDHPILRWEPFLKIAQSYAADRPQEAIRAYRHAAVLASCLADAHTLDEEGQATRERLGLEIDAEATPSPEELRSIGAIVLGEDAPEAIDLSPGRPVLFVRFENGALHSLVYTLTASGARGTYTVKSNERHDRGGLMLESTLAPGMPSSSGHRFGDFVVTPSRGMKGRVPVQLQIATQPR